MDSNHTFLTKKIKMNYLQKIILTSLIVLMAIASYAQAPEAFHYQAALRNASGSLITSQLVELRFTVRNTTATGTIQYQETKTITTNQYGLVNHAVGTGTVISGTFAGITWSTGVKYLQVEVNTGSGYVDLGAEKFQSVPYALHAKTSGQWTSSGANVYSSNSGNVGIGTASPTEKIHVVGNIYASSGDLYTSPSNGVINCGGGIMDNNSNVISDNAPTPTMATGDEDLYIDDDLEVNSNAYKPGGGTWTTISDKRLKKDVTPFTDGLSKVMQIKPVTFKYNDKVKVFDKDKVHVGIIAQDIEMIAPYMIEKKNLFQKVQENENGVEEILDQGTEYLTYDGNAMTYLLINAVQEQQKEIEELKKQLTQKEASNAGLQSRLEKIEATLGIDSQSNK